VAELLGLSQPNFVSLYQLRYPDMPRPVIDLGQGPASFCCEATIEDSEAQRANR
jgi:hypothetical protein